MRAGARPVHDIVKVRRIFRDMVRSTFGESERRTKMNRRPMLRQRLRTSCLENANIWRSTRNGPLSMEKTEWDF
jgi:hypothetical protein